LEKYIIRRGDSRGRRLEAEEAKQSIVTAGSLLSYY